MKQYLREHPVDIIHTHYRRATMLGRRIRKRQPILYTLHLSHLSLKFPRNLLTDFGDHAHVASSDARDWLIDDAHVAAEKISLIPHGVDVDRFAVADEQTKLAAREALSRELSFELRADDRVAAYVGRFDQFHPKNVEWIIDLAAATKLPMKFLLVGEGPQEQILRLMIAQRQLHDRVVLTGHRDPLTVYQAANALLLPSAREGFSLVCAEAMSVGVPVLRTRTSGTSDMIVENVTGRSTPIDRDAFLAAAIDFLADAAALKTMGQNAAKLIREKFRFDQQVARTVELYQRLINARKLA
jgi:glycosyltransferase involved in cell wall biosynthesis